MDEPMVVAEELDPAAKMAARREKVLALRAGGKTMREIASELGITLGQAREDFRWDKRRRAKAKEAEEQRKREAEAAKGPLIEESDPSCPEYLAAMRWVGRNATEHDRTSLQRHMRQWLAKDVKGFMTELGRQESLHTGAGKSGDDPVVDQGEERAAELESRFLKAMQGEGFDG